MTGSNIASASMNRQPRVKAPRIGYKRDESNTHAKRRWLTRWFDYRDLCVFWDCLYQGQFESARTHRHFFRAFYGVEGKYIVEVLA